ncbi:MAG: DUF1566 domain-containing protein [Deltaproteobacteria bacterium]|jgi:hypothetical protein|nr:DUF1566 domain-containing protein [Deltaproteobacteria bacterium]
MKKITLFVVAAILWAGCITAAENSGSGRSPVNVIAREGPLVAYDNGTVEDTDTGLMWAAEDNGGPITWEEAKRYCREYRGGGYSDWRMPTQEELAGLYNPHMTNTHPPTDGCKGGCHITNLIHLTCCPVWWWNGIDEVAAFFHFELGPKGWRDQSLTEHPRALPVRNAR